MKFDEVARALDGIPNMSAAQGRRIYDFILAHEAREVLELGTAHGVSACFMAAALHELGRGKVVTIDRFNAGARQPNVHELLQRTGLARFVEPLGTPTSYNWELMKLLEHRTTRDRVDPMFDFCYIDGAHTWETDGLAFFLAEKLLRHGGWILFDDLDWTFHRSPTLRDTEWVRRLPDEERTTPQVERIFSLLVRQHQGFDLFHVDKEWGWGWARKVPSPKPEPPLGTLALARATARRLALASRRRT